MSNPIESMDDANVPELEDSESGSESEWEEVKEEAVTTPCLFCNETQHGAIATLRHCYQEHNFDIERIQKCHQMECFGYIKMINYLRKVRPSVEEFQKKVYVNPVPWGDDSYMQPELEDDSLLQFDIEEMEIGSITTLENGGETSKTVTAEDELISIPIKKYTKLLKNLNETEKRAVNAEEQLQQAVLDLHQMRRAAQNLVTSNPDSIPSHKAVQHLQDGEDESYMDSYSHFSIHQEMLQDKVRTESYRNIFIENKEFFKNKVVLDIGCGTGILSMFAAKAGAKKVIGVDMSDIIYQAMDIVRENKLDHVITLIKGRLEDVDMPVEEFDVIVSEWMGYFLLFESMLDTVLYARDRWLKADGIMLPDNCALCITASSDQTLYQRNLEYWDNVYGFQMTCMKAAVVQEASVMLVNKEYIATDFCILKSLDIAKISTRDLEFTSPFQLTAKDDSIITALIGYFNISFTALKNKVEFSTSPADPATHWKQTVFLLHNPIELKQGKCLAGQLICRKNRKDPRSLKVLLTIGSETYTYMIQ